ncbi:MULTISPECIES: RDD family protein [unclassified Mycobacterium]|uniref:RDD family protein n=1 Tax=unclassified Mycobacterium TaxID=2642494 RepID=UPI0029C77254|nr:MULTISPECIES: RDD family protein [unclassified Mycobacterium]
MNDAEPPRNAGIVSRCVAAVIDLGVVLVIIGVLYVGLILTRLAINPSAFQLPAIGVLFSTTVTFSISVLYLAGCWAVSGCTVGAVVMGLRVRGRKSERLPGVIALLRAVACVVFPVGLAWVAVDAQRRSLQDLLFRSRVVYVSRPSS